MTAVPLTEAAPTTSAVRPRSKPQPRRRFLIPGFLPEERIEHPLPEQERAGGCCGQERVIIREHVTRQIELTRAEARVEVQVRYTYACQHCRRGDQVITTSKPAAPIDKSPFGASLLAWIISAKFERHLPTYRHQEMLLEPLGKWLSRPLLCQWLKVVAADPEAFGPAVVGGVPAELHDAGRRNAGPLSGCGPRATRCWVICLAMAVTLSIGIWGTTFGPCAIGMGRPRCWPCTVVCCRPMVMR